VPRRGIENRGISDFSLETSDKRSIRVIKTLLVQQSGKIERPLSARIHGVWNNIMARKGREIDYNKERYCTIHCRAPHNGTNDIISSSMLTHLPHFIPPLMEYFVLSGTFPLAKEYVHFISKDFIASCKTHSALCLTFKFQILSSTLPFVAQSRPRISRYTHESIPDF